MKIITVFPAAILYLTVIAAHAQSLGDLAREEQKRRDSIPFEKTATIGFAPERVLEEGDDNGETQDADTEGIGKESDSSAEKAATDRETALYGKPESQWREAMSDARNRVKQLEDEAKELTSRRNALQLNRNKINKTRRGPIDDEIGKIRAAQELNGKNQEEARKALQSLQKEARSSGALPGWTR